MNAGRLTDPLSSSPSISTVILTPPAAKPVVAFQARMASRNVATWPLSSTAPRATTRSPGPPGTAGLTTGSKGGLSHRSSGSTGCTS